MPIDTIKRTRRGRHQKGGFIVYPFGGTPRIPTCSLILEKSASLSRTSRCPLPRPMQFDPQTVSRELARGEDGVWFASKREPVSYLEEGNALCFQLEEKSFWFAHRNAC